MVKRESTIENVDAHKIARDFWKHSVFLERLICLPFKGKRDKHLQEIAMKLDTLRGLESWLSEWIQEELNQTEETRKVDVYDTRERQRKKT